MTGSGSRQHIERGDGAAASGQHRIDQQHVTVFEVLRQLRVVLRGDGGPFVSLQAQMSDARVGHELEKTREHAEARA